MPNIYQHFRLPDDVRAQIADLQEIAGGLTKTQVVINAIRDHHWRKFSRRSKDAVRIRLRREAAEEAGSGGMRG